MQNLEKYLNNFQRSDDDDDGNLHDDDHQLKNQSSIPVSLKKENSNLLNDDDDEQELSRSIQNDSSILVSVKRENINNHNKSQIDASREEDNIQQNIKYYDNDKEILNINQNELKQILYDHSDDFSKNALKVKDERKHILNFIQENLFQKINDIKNSVDARSAQLKELKIQFKTTDFSNQQRLIFYLQKIENFFQDEDFDDVALNQSIKKISDLISRNFDLILSCKNCDNSSPVLNTFNTLKHLLIMNKSSNELILSSGLKNEARLKQTIEDMNGYTEMNTKYNDLYLENKAKIMQENELISRIKSLESEIEQLKIFKMECTEKIRQDSIHIQELIDTVENLKNNIYLIEAKSENKDKLIDEIKKLNESWALITKANSTVENIPGIISQLIDKFNSINNGNFDNSIKVFTTQLDVSKASFEKISTEVKNMNFQSDINKLKEVKAEMTTELNDIVSQSKSEMRGTVEEIKNTLTNLKTVQEIKSEKEKMIKELNESLAYISEKSTVLSEENKRKYEECIQVLNSNLKLTEKATTNLNKEFENNKTELNKIMNEAIDKLNKGLHINNQNENKIIELMNKSIKEVHEKNQALFDSYTNLSKLNLTNMHAKTEEIMKKLIEEKTQESLNIVNIFSDINTKLNDTITLNFTKMEARSNDIITKIENFNTENVNRFFNIQESINKSLSNVENKFHTKIKDIEMTILKEIETYKMIQNKEIEKIHAMFSTEINKILIQELSDFKSDAKLRTETFKSQQSDLASKIQSDIVVDLNKFQEASKSAYSQNVTESEKMFQSNLNNLTKEIEIINLNHQSLIKNFELLNEKTVGNISQQTEDLKKNIINFQKNLSETKEKFDNIILKVKEDSNVEKMLESKENLNAEIKSHIDKVKDFTELYSQMFNQQILEFSKLFESKQEEYSKTMDEKFKLKETSIKSVLNEEQMSITQYAKETSTEIQGLSTMLKSFLKDIKTQVEENQETLNDSSLKIRAGYREHLKKMTNSLEQNFTENTELITETNSKIKKDLLDHGTKMKTLFKETSEGNERNIKQSFEEINKTLKSNKSLLESSTKTLELDVTKCLEIFKTSLNDQIKTFNEKADKERAKSFETNIDSLRTGIQLNLQSYITRINLIMEEKLEVFRKIELISKGFEAELTNKIKTISYNLDEFLKVMSSTTSIIKEKVGQTTSKIAENLAIFEDKVNSAIELKSNVLEKNIKLSETILQKIDTISKNNTDMSDLIVQKLMNIGEESLRDSMKNYIPQVLNETHQTNIAVVIKFEEKLKRLQTEYNKICLDIDKKLQEYQKNLKIDQLKESLIQSEMSIRGSILSDVELLFDEKSKPLERKLSKFEEFMEGFLDYEITTSNSVLSNKELKEYDELKDFISPVLENIRKRMVKLKEITKSSSTFQDNLTHFTTKTSAFTKVKEIITSTSKSTFTPEIIASLKTETKNIQEILQDEQKLCLSFIAFLESFYKTDKTDTIKFNNILKDPYSLNPNFASFMSILFLFKQSMVNTNNMNSYTNVFSLVFG